MADSAMRNCGKTFHQEVGKFKFLNELIKLVSPKVRCADHLFLVFPNYLVICSMMEGKLHPL